ncbi:MAG: J domain-containing protein [Spirochaetaceae bacterium]
MDRFPGFFRFAWRTKIKTLGLFLWKHHRGKLICSLVGLLSGLRLFGLIFGLLFGYLIDTIIEHYRLQKEVKHFEGGGKLSHTPAGRVAAATICALETAASAKRAVFATRAAPAENRPSARRASSTEKAPSAKKGEERKRIEADSEGGSLDSQEVELVKRQIIRNFALSASGTEAVRAVNPAKAGGEGREVFEALLDSKIAFEDSSEQFALMQTLFESASLFGPVPGETRELIEGVTKAFGISPETARMADLMYRSRDTESYRILGLEPEAPAGEIKRVYRALAVQFHPDSLHSLEPHQRKAAEEAFLKIRNAYESIMKEHSRG